MCRWTLYDHETLATARHPREKATQGIRHIPRPYAPRGHVAQLYNVALLVLCDSHREPGSLLFFCYLLLTEVSQGGGVSAPVVDMGMGTETTCRTPFPSETRYLHAFCHGLVTAVVSVTKITRYQFG